MKSVAISCAGLLLLAATVSANDLAVSDSALGNMGLDGMHRISDGDGLAVRGKGTYANVWGGSSAIQQQVATSPWGSHAAGPATTSTNNYQAGAQWLGKNSGANGQSLSFAGHVEAHFVGPNLAGLALGAHIATGVTGTIAN